MASSKTNIFTKYRHLSYSSSSTSDSVITTAVSVLKHHRSKSRWGHLRTLFPSGFIPTQFSQITLQIRNNPHLALNFFQFTVRHSLCNHSLLSYATIIHILARGRLKAEAQTLIQSALVKFQAPSSSSEPPQLFETLVKTYRACDSAPFVFDLLIEACLQSNRIDQGIEIVRLLRSKSINPKISTCNSLIRSVAKIRGSVAGYDMYNEVFVLNGGKNLIPNAQTFNIIMLGCYQDKHFQNVVDVWDEMVRVDCEANVYSYSILMASYCEDGKIGEAVRVWEEMKVKNMSYDFAAYNTMISGFCKVGELVKAEEFFREMEVSGLNSTCVTYEHLINGYCVIGDLDTAVLLYNEAVRKEFRLDGFIIDAFVKGLCEKNRVCEALEFFRVSMKEHGFYPKRETYEFLIKGLCEDQKIDKALKLQAEMVGKGYNPNSETYNAFINAYMKLGNKEQAEKLIIEMNDQELRRSN